MSRLRLGSWFSDGDIAPLSSAELCMESMYPAGPSPSGAALGLGHCLEEEPQRKVVRGAGLWS